MEKNDYIIDNRELSWLGFNERVLEEANISTNPLMERLKFLAITSSNLDEFFMVRVAGIKQQIAANYKKIDPSGLNPKQQIRRVGDRCKELVESQYACYSELEKLLEAENIQIIRPKDMSTKESVFLERFFIENVYPVLTPLAVDAGRPFPQVSNKTINLAVRLKPDKNMLPEDAEHAEDDLFALVQSPEILGRYVRLPTLSTHRFMLLEDVILLNIDRLFDGHKVMAVNLFRVTRDGDLSIDEDADDLLREIEKSLKERKWGHPVRLEIMRSYSLKEPDKKTLDFLKDGFDTRKRDVYMCDGPLDFTFLFKFASQGAFDNLRYDSRRPRLAKDFLGVDDIFAAIRERDRMVHVPYESFSSVLDFVNTAADDPSVLAIKQTLYRVSGNSPIVAALMQAAENGKQVTVLVELKARFDEENNIIWARRMESAGCHVVYGLVGLKVHCKTLLIVRREEDGIRRYVHMGTGNYNDNTAKLYTDMSVFTCRESVGYDVSALFNLLTGYSSPPSFQDIIVAPTNLRSFFYERIQTEIDNALAGREARIIAKVNSLIDPGIITKLYEASNAGVRVDLIVRGVNGLRSQIHGMSENIHVRSIIGRYLEHHRIFYFNDGGKHLVYLSSADWMPRNLDRRIEVSFPVEQADLKARVIDDLHLMLSDNIMARVQNTDGTYSRLTPQAGEEPIASQDVFYKNLEDWHKEAQNVVRSSFIPRHSIDAE